MRKENMFLHISRIYDIYDTVKFDYLTNEVYLVIVDCFLHTKITFAFM
jgi:hypothetical protein